MSGIDVRWVQRFSNYKKALAKLKEVATGERVNLLTELEKEGMIHRFEYTYELAWKTLQDLLAYNGYKDIVGPNPVLEQALSDGYIADEVGWRSMKKARELSSHTYNAVTADDIASNIAGTYCSLFMLLEQRLDRESEIK
jgi:nucleotidyltransferase substrate binding protein (TIGR01987 family)